MSGFGAFFLFVAAMVGTAMLLLSPENKLRKRYAGKTEGELKKDIEDYIENNTGEAIAKGCGWLLYALLALLFNYVIEPLVALSALVDNIGWKPLGYAVLVVILISWIYAYVAYQQTKKRAEARKAVTVKTEDGTATGTPVTDDKLLEMPNPTLTVLRRAFFAIPTLYMWYVFVVGIGLVG